MSAEIMKDLQAPFHPDDIEWRVGATNADKTKGIALAYVTNRAIQNRLDEIFGPFGWKNEFREWKEQSQLCGISIKFGDEWITKWDGADDSNTEATKGGLSDAMKRAGYQWGIGRYLYKLENMWVPIKPQGKSYALVYEPKLPNWALPEELREDESLNEIRKQSKLNVVMAKWQTCSGEKDKNKSQESFENYLKEKGFTIETVTDDFLSNLEESLTKKIMEKKKGAYH